MSGMGLFFSVVVTPFFASRGFLATFVVALVCRFAADLVGVADVDVLKMAANAPGWFTHDVTLVVLGLLAALEVAATKDPDARALLNDIDSAIKPTLNWAVSFGLISSQDLAVLQPTMMGVEPALAVSAAPAFLTFVMARMRARFLGALYEADMGDDLGVQGLLAWVEDAWVLTGPVVMALVPAVLAGLLAATAFATLAAARVAVGWLDERNKEPCPSCDHLLHPTAPHCGACGAGRAGVRAAGVFGRAREAAAPGAAAHAFALASWGRCPRCAERLGQRGPHQTCGQCGEVTFDSPAALQEYLRHTDLQLLKTLAVSFVFGLVPVAGLLPGILYYRLSLVSRVRRYVPRTTGCLTRWAVRGFNLLLILLQPVPLLGAFMLPILCFSNYRLYRAALVASAPGDAVVPAPA